MTQPKKAPAGAGALGISEAAWPGSTGTAPPAEMINTLQRSYDGGTVRGNQRDGKPFALTVPGGDPETVTRRVRELRAAALLVDPVGRVGVMIKQTRESDGSVKLLFRARVRRGKAGQAE